MFGANPYSPYAPYGYQTPGFGGQGYPQQPQQNQQQSGPGWVMAPTIRDVDHVSVAPGGQAWVMVQNEPVFALRTADKMGLITTDYYRFEKYNPDAGAAPAQDYVTRAEFEQFVQSLTQTAPQKKEEQK